MTEFDFTLRFDIKTLDITPAECADRLYGAGCDDALIGTGTPGYIALNFIREAECAHHAVITALKDVRRSLPHAPLVEASPDLGGVSDIAKLMNCSRQNTRKLISLAQDCPPPIHVGKYPIWHMSEVLSHLNATRNCDISEDIIALTKVIQYINSENDYHKHDLFESRYYVKELVNS